METNKPYYTESRIHSVDGPGKLDIRTSNVHHIAPSSSTAGFFQSPPQVLNQYEDDTALRRAMKLFLPHGVQEALKADLSAFGEHVLSRQTLGWVLEAERNLPYVKTWDTWGKRRDELITSDGWKNLQRMGIEAGIVAIPYENSFQEFSRIYWCTKYILWCGSSAWVNCPSLIVDGVASLFREHLSDDTLGEERQVLQDAYTRLISRDGEKAWTSGQWMTERQGGSDVRMTETVATYAPNCQSNEEEEDGHGNPLGPWLLDGFKWFSSATDANMAILLARTEKGISLFYAPMRRALKEKDAMGFETASNGVYIQRLKNKLGTKALPTAELEIKGMRGWLVGEEGRGTKEIATVLNVARLHNAATAVGLWGRGLGIVRAFARVRVVGRKPLYERAGFMRNLARMHTEYRANVLFTFFVSGLLGCAEQAKIAKLAGEQGKGVDKMGKLPNVTDTPMAVWLLRIFTPLLKGHCAKTGITGLQECMECLGGVGYLENDDMQFNIARLYRDANIVPIWEGTTDMMADDAILRVLYGKNRTEVMRALSKWVTAVLEQNARQGSDIKTVASWWTDFKQTLIDLPKSDIERHARDIMSRLVDIVQGLLLIIDAASDGDDVAQLVKECWFADKCEGKSLKPSSGRSSTNLQTSDMRIVFQKAKLDSLGAKI
ncbi:Acyl-CoA dehydrogenase, middle domain-containing protein [Cladophialophora immunda]|nr:Acyl-CoA dehydrogenase, middle domain-containing protein [Cladophialophora immunda]